MIGASAEVAILKLFCIFNNFVSFSRRIYPAKHNILLPTLENSRYIFSNLSLYFGVYNINSGLATSQCQICQYIYVSVQLDCT